MGTSKHNIKGVVVQDHLLISSHCLFLLLHLFNPQRQMEESIKVGCCFFCMCCFCFWFVSFDCHVFGCFSHNSLYSMFSSFFFFFQPFFQLVALISIIIIIIIMAMMAVMDLVVSKQGRMRMRYRWNLL